MATRDFTPEALDLMEENLDTDAGWLWDYIGDFFSPTENVALNEDMSNLSEYLAACMEIENIGKKQLNKIVEAVGTTEDNYKEKFATNLTNFDAIKSSCDKENLLFTEIRNTYLETEISLEQALDLIENPISKKYIMTLRPEARIYFALLVLELEKYQREHNLGGYFIIGDGYRGEAAQQQALDNGSSRAKYGEGWHNYGMAVDIYFYKGEFDPDVGMPPMREAISLPGIVSQHDTNAVQVLIDIGKKFGLEYGGAWASFKDPPHFELNGGLGNNPKNIVPSDFKLSDDTYFEAPLPQNFNFPKVPPYREYSSKNEDK